MLFRSVGHAVPIDLRALKALKSSPLALDIYSWLTYRMSYLRKPCLIPWEALKAQFGAAYGRPRDFKRKFLRHLRDVLHVYPGARLCERPAGLFLQPSRTHLPRRSLSDLKAGETGRGAASRERGTNSPGRSAPHRRRNC